MTEGTGSGGTTQRFGCVLIGADSLLIECGEILLQRGHEVVAVAAGSARVADWARGRSLGVIDATGPADGWAVQLEGLRFDWLFAITHLALLPDRVLSLAAKGSINFHDGPLPRYAGLHTPAWALLRGEPRYGISWHHITAGVDEGDIVLQREFDVAPDETSLSINTRNFEAAIESFAELVDQLALGTATRTPQGEARDRVVYRRLDRPEAMSVLDWRRPAIELERLVRALDFGRYPNPLGRAALWTGHDVVSVVRAVAVSSDLTATPGAVVEQAPDHLVIGCGVGLLRIEEVVCRTGLALALSSVLPPGSVGHQLPVLDDHQRRALTDVGAAAARSERPLLDALAAFVPAPLPWSRRTGADHAARLSEAIAIEAPRSAGAPAPEAVPATDATMVASLAVLLARASGSAGFGVALVDAAVTGAALGAIHDDPAAHDAAIPLLQPAAGLFAPAVPLHLAVEPTAAGGDVVAAVRSALEQARRRGPMAANLASREPELVHRAPVLLGPVGVRLGAGDGPGAPGVVLELAERDGEWRLHFDPLAVRRVEAEDIARSLCAVASGLLASPGTTVADLPIVDDAQRSDVLERWNATGRDVPADRCVHDLIDDQIRRTPDAVAVAFDGESLTYAGLDDRAARLATHLRGLGVGPDVLVGIHLERGIDLVVAVLAVLRAGGAYVPLDPSYPADRIRHMIADSRCRVIVTDAALARSVPVPSDMSSPPVALVRVDADRDAIAACSAERADTGVRPGHLAYCIYTSGSTGVPKGVLVEHRNVVNFVVAMDDCVDHDTPAAWLAVTSLSFDISVLELVYTLARGFSVVVHSDRDRVRPGAGSPGGLPSTNRIDVSLFYFSGDEAADRATGKYRLLLEGARFADEHGFSAVWTPERHFHAFGGLYPDPSVTGAAVAAITERVSIRAGSVVLPLHHPIRVAEAWSVVDNISNGRVGLAVASGWQPNDFVIRPESYADAKQVMFDQLETVRSLWRGDRVTFPGTTGAPVEIGTLPRPVQAELPVWITTAGNPDTYVQAGRIGANVLTHLLGQSVEQLAPKIAAYRAARAEAGFDPATGVVSLMLHTYVGDDDAVVRDAVREPLKQYLATSASLVKEYVWSFPAFARPGGEDAPGSHGVDSLADDDFASLSDDELDTVLEFAFQRYYETSGLFGTPDMCLSMIDRLVEVGVDEVACLVDFGIATDDVLAALPHLDEVRRRANETAADGDAEPARNATSRLTVETPEEHGIAALVARHGVTHLQCTPSMARMLTVHDEARAALAHLRHLYIGGEAFPPALADDLRRLAPQCRITNMYGPTETTIWSTTWPLADGAHHVPIGSPIANTTIYVLDDRRRPVPPGVPGHLWIGGLGVVRGYHERPELTAERFVVDPFATEPDPDGNPRRMYDTGDLALWRRDESGGALLEYLGRGDQQVKLRGHRIELGEIEAHLGKLAGVLECAVVVRDDHHGEQQLVAFVAASDGADVAAVSVRERLRRHLPEFMLPTHVVRLDVLPHTPNGKVDRNALPASVRDAGPRRGVGPTAGAAATAGAAGRATGTATLTSELERDVLAIWEDVLGADGIGPDDNFFDIGGHSLLVVRLHRRLREAVDPTVALTDLYRYPTVRAFVASRRPAGDGADATAGSGPSALQASVDRGARRRAAMQRRRGDG